MPVTVPYGRRRPVLAAALIAGAVLALSLASAVMLGHSLSWRLFGVRIRLNDLSNALVAGGVLASTVLILWRRHDTIRLISLVVLAVCGLLVLVAIARQAPEYGPAGDLAIIESDTILATQGLVLTGPYSRFGWHHPGPLYFYVLAPFYVLSGHRTTGLSAAAVAINILSILLVVGVVAREGRGLLALLIAAACLLFAARFSDMMASAWNPHVLVLPTLAVVVLSAAVACGRASLLPLAAAVATFAGQTHVGLMPTMVLVPGLAVLTWAARTWRGSGAAERRRFWWTANATLWVLAILWLLPIAEELGRAPGNMSRLWTFFVTSDHKGQAFWPAFLAWADAITGTSRPAFLTAWGQPRSGGLAAWIWLLASGQVVLLGVVAARERNRQAFHAALAALLAVTSLVALWSTVRIQGDIVDHNLFWLAALGAAGLAVIVEAALGTLTAIWPHVQMSLRPAGVRWACGMICASVVVIGVWRLELANHYAWRRIEPEAIAAQTLSDEIVRYLRPSQGKLLLRVDLAPAWAVAAGVVVELQKAHVPFAIEDDAVWMFSDALGAAGTEKVAVMIAGRRQHLALMGQPGVIMIATRRDFFADLVPTPR